MASSVLKLKDGPVENRILLIDDDPDVAALFRRMLKTLNSDTVLHWHLNAENGLKAATRESAAGRHYVSGDIEIIHGDIFKLDAATLATCDGVYDRAALIALPPPMRAPYVDHVYRQLPARYRGLLITLDYRQELMNGPPFSVPDDEVQDLYRGHAEAEILERSDILREEPKFAERGLKALDTLAYRLQGKRQG